MSRRTRFPEHPTPFAQLLINYMMAHYLNESELADHLGVSPNAVNKWIQKGTALRYPFQYVPRLARATGIPEHEFYQALGLAVGPPPAPPRGPDVLRPPSPEEVQHHYLEALRTVQDPRLTQELRALMIEIATRIWSGESAYARQIASEHTVVEGTIASHGDDIAERPTMPTESVQRVIGQPGGPRRPE